MIGKEVKDFYNIDYSDMTLPLFAVFNSPSDFPGKFVARLFDVNRPTNVYALADSYEEIKELQPDWTITMNRSENDDPVIVETWL